MKIAGFCRLLNTGTIGVHKWKQEYQGHAVGHCGLLGSTIFLLMLLEA